MNKRKRTIAAVVALIVAPGIAWAATQDNVYAPPVAAGRAYNEPTPSAYRPWICSAFDRHEEVTGDELERNYSDPATTVAIHCPEHAVAFDAVMARPTATIAPRPTWTPAPAPASMLDYETSTGALRNTWDMYTQSMRDDACAKNFYMDMGLDDMYDDRAVADFKALVC